MSESQIADAASQLLDGRVALVTGGSRGIGRACCLKLAAAGAKVAINYRSDRQAAEEAARLISNGGGTSLVVQADVSQPDQVEWMVAQVEKQLGPVDLLVNNAGVFDFVPHSQTTLDIWQRTLEVNLTGTYLVTWAVKDSMAARKFGRIVNVSSISALEPRPMSIAYAASKAGVVALTRSLAAALADCNIRANAVAPGLIETEILDGVEQGALDRIIASTPMQRIGTPDEVADVVLFLLSEQSSFMTGQTLIICGGRVMRG